MRIDLYVNKSDKRVINKNIELKRQENVKLLEECEIIKPNLKLTLNDDLLKCNYLYIEKFKRFYFIDNIKIMSQNIAIIECSVDVLMSFSTVICDSQLNITRSSNRRNNYLIDSGIKKSSKKVMRYEKIPTTIFDIDSTNILILNGGSL